MTTVNHHRRPLWAQVLTDLERRLSTGEFDANFPTDRELIEQYDVSRHTVREAVRRLHERGVIERHRGRGSFVNPRWHNRSMGGIYNLLQTLRQRGLTLRSEVRSLERVHDPQVATRLRLPRDAGLIRIERVRLVDDEPLGRDTAWLPGDVAAPLLDADFTRSSLWDELSLRIGIQITSTEETVKPRVPDDDLRRQLTLAADEALLEVDRLSFAENTPIEHRLTLLRGERFPYMAAWDVRSHLSAEIPRAPEPLPDGGVRKDR